MQLYLVLSIPIIFMICWLYTSSTARASFPRLRNKRICLLIAHPDDEAMFFAPAVIALTEESLGNHLKILCLSSGDAESLGQIRKGELAQSASILGLRSENDVLVIEDPAFPDNMTTTWDAEKIARILTSAFTFSIKSKVRLPAGKTANDVAPTASIDVLITFDQRGISDHPNHISLYHGAIAWIKEMMKGKSGWECPVTVYTLRSTSILRKYISVLDAPITMLSCVLNSMSIAGRRRSENTTPERLMFVSDIGAYCKAQKAMVNAHKSQMKWFRWGWIGIGRYMVVNDLKKITPASI